MDVYSLFKFLHVLCAVAWVGGGLTLMVNAAIANRSGDDAAILKSLDVMNALGKVWFVPASLLTVVFGAITAVLGGTILELWVLLGLVGFAWTFFTGILIIEPTGRKIGGLIEAGRMEDAVTRGRGLLRIGKFDYTVMLVVVADMVLKPYWTDLPVLALFALAIGAGAWFFLLGGRLPARMQAA